MLNNSSGNSTDKHQTDENRSAAFFRKNIDLLDLTAEEVHIFDAQDLSGNNIRVLTSNVKEITLIKRKNKTLLLAPTISQANKTGLTYRGLALHLSSIASKHINLPDEIICLMIYHVSLAETSEAKYKLRITRKEVPCLNVPDSVYLANKLFDRLESYCKAIYQPLLVKCSTVRVVRACGEIDTSLDERVPSFIKEGIEFALRSIHSSGDIKLKKGMELQSLIREII